MSSAAMIPETEALDFLRGGSIVSPEKVVTYIWARLVSYSLFEESFSAVIFFTMPIFIIEFMNLF